MVGVVAVARLSAELQPWIDLHGLLIPLPAALLAGPSAAPSTLRPGGPGLLRGMAVLLFPLRMPHRGLSGGRGKPPFPLPYLPFVDPRLRLSRVRGRRPHPGRHGLSGLPPALRLRPAAVLARGSVCGPAAGAPPLRVRSAPGSRLAAVVVRSFLAVLASVGGGVPVHEKSRA